MSDIRLITIDLDDTLWPCKPTIDAAETELYAWLAAHAPRLTERHDQASLREHRRSLMMLRPEVAHDLTAVRLLSLQALLEDAGHVSTLAEEAMDVFLDARNQVQPLFCLGLCTLPSYRNNCYRRQGHEPFRWLPPLVLLVLLLRLVLRLFVLRLLVLLRAAGTFVGRRVRISQLPPPPPILLPQGRPEKNANTTTSAFLPSCIVSFVTPKRTERPSTQPR